MTLIPWLVWLLPILAAPLVFVVERVNSALCRWFSVAIVGGSVILSLSQAISFASPQVETLGGWSLYGQVEAEVYVDGLSVLLALFVSALSLAIVVYSAGIMSKEEGQGRFYFLMLVFIGSMLGLVMAGNLVQLYLLWEILGICSALLIAFWRDREPARKAGLKAFLFTRVGDAALLIAVVTVLAGLHTTDIGQVLSAASANAGGVNWTLVGFLFLLGAMGKSAQVPLHVWLPDAMEGPTPVSALIHAATMVNAGVYLLVRTSPIIVVSPFLSDSVVAVGLASLLVGGISACAATDIKRVLANSTISQLGLMFVSVGIGSVAGAVYQLVGQGLFKALAFMAAGSLAEATGTRDITKLGGLRTRMKVTFAGFFASALAMAGFPPLFGFWTKEVVVTAARYSGPLVLSAVLAGSALTTFYIFRVLFRVFAGDEASPNPEPREPGALMLGPVAALSAVAVAGWVGVAYQGIYFPPLDTTVDALAASTSLGFASAALVFCYVTFVARRRAVVELFGRSAGLRKAVGWMSSGLGFDAFYSAVYRRLFVPLPRLASRLQTGDLGDNMALLLVALAATLLLAFLVGT